MGYTAIFGGTFNPPHIGHLEMLKALNSISEIEKIWIMPTNIPPHKECDFLANDNDRAEMCKLLASDFSKATVCLDEFSREGKSYTYDTVTLFRKLYPKENFAFVCGGDMLTTFDEWYRYKELMTMLPFFVFRRSDIDDNLFNEKAKEFKKMGMKITVIDTKIKEISSTEIRKDILKNRESVPEKIYSYIENEGIYGAK